MSNMQVKFDTEVNPMDYIINLPNKRSNYYRANNHKKIGSNSLHSLTFDRPKMIGYFSVNEYREFVPDASKLRYLKMPQTRNVQLDLNNGYEVFRHKPESVKREKMDFLLRFILNNIDKLRAKNGYRGSNKFLNPDIICSRGRLVQIMCPEYITDNRDNKWSLIVSKYKGNIYICQPDGNDFHTVQSTYGFKFEQYLLTENPLDDPITDVPVIESEEFYAVFESQIGNMSLLYNAEMDGIDSREAVDLSETDFDQLKFVELKTSRGTNPRRYCRWWAQMFLAGVSDLTLGYRTKDGIVFEIETLPTEMLLKHEEANWSPNKCFDLLKRFLNTVHFLCHNEDCPDTVYKFDYDGKAKNIQCTIFKGRNEHSFLPTWYIDELNGLTKR